MRTATLTLAVLITGCAVVEPDPAGTPEPSELEATMRAVGASLDVFGCGDVSVGIRTAADRRGLQGTFRADLAADAYALGAPTSAVFALPDPDVTLSVLWGTEVSQPFCNDVLSPGYSITGEAPAISGTVTVEVVPDGHGTELMPTGHATLWFEDVVFEDPTTGEQRTLPDIELTDVYVGWLPG